MKIVISDTCPLLSSGELTGPVLSDVMKQVPVSFSLVGVTRPPGLIVLEFNELGGTDSGTYQIERVTTIKLVKREAKR